MTDALALRAQELLEAMRDSLSCGGSAETWVAYETPEGGFTLIEDCQDEPESFRWDRGARRVWRVRRQGARLIAEGFEGDSCCRMESPAPRVPALRMLERTVPFEYAAK